MYIVHYWDRYHDNDDTDTDEDVDVNYLSSKKTTDLAFCSGKTKMPAKSTS